MNSIETIQAAIDRLEEILDETGRYGWEVQEATGLPHYTGNPRVWRLDQIGTYGDTAEEQAQIVPIYDLLTTSDRSPFLAKALVTLHGTIEAQIQVLRAGRAIYYGSFGNQVPPEVPEIALNLARAILGEVVADD